MGFFSYSIEIMANVDRSVSRSWLKAYFHAAATTLATDNYILTRDNQMANAALATEYADRALALDPDYILMDEPFGALDPITRNGIHDEFLRLKDEVKKTIIMVTHDISEAFKLGDRIALMSEGKLVQVGTEDDFRSRPASDFVKEFLQLGGDS